MVHYLLELKYYSSSNDREASERRDEVVKSGKVHARSRSKVGQKVQVFLSRSNAFRSRHRPGKSRALKGKELIVLIMPV